MNNLEVVLGLNTNFRTTSIMPKLLKTLFYSAK